jgi:hypothetical protein
VNFATVLQTVVDFLEGRRARYAVIGGVAVVMYGFPRTTLDLDLIVESSVQNDLVRWLESLGYQTLHRSTGYSNHSERTLREQEDIRFLLSLPGVDRREVRSYFERHGLVERFDELV